MTKKDKVIMTMLVLMLFAVTIISNINFSQIFALPDNFKSNYTEIDNANKTNKFGSFVRTQFEEDGKSVSSEKDRTGSVVFKLFGLIPIRKVSVSILPEEEVYVGGVPIGISVNTDGVIVMSDSSFETENGEIKEIKNSVLKKRRYYN